MRRLSNHVKVIEPDLHKVLLFIVKAGVQIVADSLVELELLLADLLNLKISHLLCTSCYPSAKGIKEGYRFNSNAQEKIFCLLQDVHNKYLKESPSFCGASFQGHLDQVKTRRKLKKESQ